MGEDLELFTRGPRSIVRALGDLVESFDYRGGRMCFIKLKDPLVNNLYITQVPIGFSFDMKTIMATSLTLISKENMNDEGKRIYQTMKGMECVLEYSGILAKKPSFVQRPELATLSKMVNGLSVNSMLRERLNKDQELISLLKSLKPSDVRVSLKSYDLPMFMPGDKVGMLVSEANYFNDPGEVTWIISLSAMLPASIFYKRNVMKAFNIIKIIAKHVSESFKSLYIK